MIALADNNDASHLQTAYGQFLRNLRVRQAQVGYLLPLGLVPAASSLDYFVYNELFWPMLKSRLLCQAALMPFYGLLFTKFGKRQMWFLGNAWLMAPMLIICWMIYASEGAQSPYYAGLNLVLLAGCLLTTYDAKRAGFFCGTVVLCYSLACYLHELHPPASTLHKSTLLHGSIMFNNLYFLIATSAVCVAACYFSARRRFEDFRLRHDLDVNNRRLAVTVKKLQDTEVQLVQSEKMNALGKLSAGLLHEINNPLNFTFMALDVAHAETTPNTDLAEALDDIRQGMVRIKDVISDLRAFAHPTRLSEAETFKVSEVLGTALLLTSHELQDIPIEQMGVDGATAIGAKTQIVHVLMNLLVNSANALRDKNGGKDGRIVIRCTVNDDRLEVAVEDNGPGVAPENLPRLLEPFFTTKEPGKGTGLGLSICHTIVKNHGGEIKITTEYGKWTRVAFDLPRKVSSTVQSYAN